MIDLLFAQSSIAWDWSFDGWIIATGVLCSAGAALLGNFLVIRRMSLMGDAISHSVLPGIVAAYWLTGSAGSLPMFVGAVVVGLLTVWLTEWTRGYGGVDESAATGVVFTGLFALGLIMVVRMANQVDLDLSCVLYGDIENTPLDMSEWFPNLPRSTVMAGVVFLINLLFVLTFRRELQITSFDPQLSSSLGIPPAAMHYALASLVAVTSVSSFESVGNILVVSMFVVPPATAWLLTKRIQSMILVSLVIATLSAVLGHWMAVAVPAYFGLGSTSTAAMMTAVAGLFLFLAILLGPHDGFLVQIYRRYWLSTRILSEDVLALLYRDEEHHHSKKSWAEIRSQLIASPIGFRIATGLLRMGGQIRWDATGVALTDLGRSVAQNLVRSHRLWEQYLATEAGVDQQRLHAQAESLEHFTNRHLRDRLDSETGRAEIDPHGSRIPPEGVP